MTKNRLLLMHTVSLTLSLLMCRSVFSQQTVHDPSKDHCGSARAMEELYKRNPASKAAAAKLETFTRSFVANEQRKRLARDPAPPATYVIPVVFHVNDPVNPGKVTLEQIKSAIEILNEDYNARNADLQEVDPRFKGITANPGIAFRLADIDPNGNPTNGVTYHYNDLDGRAPNGTGQAVKSISYWPGEKYLNIWIVSEVEKKGVFNNSGWAYYPDNSIAASKLDGIMYNWRYLGRPGVGSSENSAPHMKRVLTHEVGHFLNLIHTFENECAAPGDKVDDTPPTKSNYGDCNKNANWCGTVANVENYMDYSSCGHMFTLGQADRMLAALHATVAGRNNLWSAANLAATLLPRATKRIIFSNTGFTEQDTNDGSIGVTSQIKGVDGAKFALSSGTLVNGTHYTVQNLPAGLSASIVLATDSTATLSFTGRASAHDAANNSSNLKITWLPAAIRGGLSGLFNTATTMSITFMDAYKIVYNDMDDIEVSANKVWQWFTFGVGDAQFGGFYLNGGLKLETYTKAAVCEGTTRNISPLAPNTVIGSSSSFVAGGEYPDLHDIRSASYTKWDGKTAFIGVRFTINGKNRYGWIRAAVSADGKTLTIKDYAYNEVPNASIKTGETDGPLVSWSGNGFKETTANDGTVGRTTELTCLNATFARTGSFTNGTHYTVSNLPSGLTLSISASNTTTAAVSISGKATYHTAVDSKEAAITLLPAAFVAMPGNPTIANSIKKLPVTFRDPYGIKYVDVDDNAFTVNESNDWKYFELEGTNNKDGEYGVWYEEGKLLFETYHKPMVCTNAGRTISLLPDSTLIGPASNFVPGGAFPDQHILVSPTYTNWKGRTGYVGYKFVGDGDTYYGWFRFKVNADGSSYSLLDYAYNTQPDKPIKAGKREDNAPVTAYCIATTEKNNLFIKQVKFAGVNQASNWGEVGYSNFTSLIANVKKGQTYDLEVGLNVESWTDTDVAAWIDWNSDKVFDAAERIYVKHGTGPFKATISVPATAKDGSTRLRIRTGYNSTLNPCGHDTYMGEVEDYTVNIGGTIQAYCTASTMLNHNIINRVRFAGIDQSSAWNSYSNFTSSTATVSAGKTYDMEMNLQVEYWPDITVAVWIDWNGDQVFDAGEKVYSRRGPGPYKPAITVPANVIPGVTRMRVRMGYGKDLTACGVDTYQGEVEDYSVNVLPAGTAAGKVLSAPVPETQKTTISGLRAVNPFVNDLRFWYHARKAGFIHVRLVNIQGHVVTQKVYNVAAGENMLQINNLQSLLPGFHILEVTTNGQREQLKVLKVSSH